MTVHNLAQSVLPGDEDHIKQEIATNSNSNPKRYCKTQKQKDMAHENVLLIKEVEKSGTISNLVSMVLYQQKGDNMTICGLFGSTQL